MNYTTAQLPRREKNALRLELRRRLGLPRYTLGEEIFSAVSHGVSALYAVGALVWLLLTCRPTALRLVSAAVFGGTMVLLYTVSTLYQGPAGAHHVRGGPAGGPARAGGGGVPAVPGQSPGRGLAGPQRRRRREGFGPGPGLLGWLRPSPACCGAGTS